MDIKTQNQIEIETWHSSCKRIYKIKNSR